MNPRWRIGVTALAVVAAIAAALVLPLAWGPAGETGMDQEHGSGTGNGNGTTVSDSSLMALPPSLGGLIMKGNPLTGKEAVASVSQLHGKELDLKDAYVAEYAAPDGSMAILWVSISVTVEEAGELLRRMNNRMPQSPVFTDLQEIKSGELIIYRVYGQGMSHYYWSQGRSVIWVAIHANNEGEVFNKLLQSLIDLK